MPLAHRDPGCIYLRSVIARWADTNAELAAGLGVLLTGQDEPPAVTGPRHLHLVPQPLQCRQKQLPRPPAWRSLYVAHHVAATVLIAAAAAAASGMLSALMG